jgi:hypothetical protein
LLFIVPRHLFLSVLAHALGNVPGYCQASRFAGLCAKETGSWQMAISKWRQMNQQTAFDESQWK